MPDQTDPPTKAKRGLLRRLIAPFVATSLTGVVIGLAFLVLPRTTGSFSITSSVDSARPAFRDTAMAPNEAASPSEASEDARAPPPLEGPAQAQAAGEAPAPDSDAPAAVGPDGGAATPADPAARVAPVPPAPAPEKREPFVVTPNAVTISTASRNEVLSLSYSGVSPGDVLTAVASYQLFNGMAASNLPLGQPVKVPNGAFDSYTYTSPPFDARPLAPYKGSKGTITITNLTKNETRSLTLLIQ